MKKNFDQIDHNLVILSDDEKFPYLLNTLKEKKDSKTIVFCNGPFNIELVSQWLEKAEVKSEKATRDTKSFFESSQIVVCDDSSLRNLENTEVDYVVNYELPKRSGNYLERVSKTKDESGKAVSLCGYRDCENLDAIEDHFNLKIERQYVEDIDLATDVPAQPELNPADFKRVREPRNSRDSRDRKPREKREEKNFNSSEEAKVKEPRKDNKKMQTQPTPRKVITPAPSVFKISTNSKQEAYDKALEFFKLEDTNSLNANILSQGAKKYLFFGPQETTYEFTFTSGYRNKIEPFLKELLSKMGVKLTYRIEEDPKNFKIHLEGEDLGLVLNNRKQLMFAIDSIVRQYVIKRVQMPRKIRVSVYAQGTHQKERNADSPRSPRKGKSRDSKFNNNKGDRPRRSKKVVNEDQLNSLAKDLKNEVMETGSSQRTDTLHPAERRIIHQFFENETNFTTTSIGDGRFKKIEVSIVNQ